MSIKATFPAGVNQVTVHGLHQWDYGRQLQIEAADLPALLEVHFACPGMKEAAVRPCFGSSGVATVTIPDECLEQSAPITAWIFEINGTTGATTKTIILPVISRARPSVSDEVPEEIVDKYTESIGAINDLIEAFTAGEIVAGKAKTAETAATAAAATAANTAALATLATKATEADHAETADNAMQADNAAAAEYATQAARADLASNAGQINGLTIERDANGVLKIGDYVIPQRYLRMHTTWVPTTVTSTMFVANDSLQGRTFELVDGQGRVYIFTVCGEDYFVETGWVAFFLNNTLFLSVDPKAPNELRARVSDGVVLDFTHLYEIIQ